MTRDEVCKEIEKEMQGYRADQIAQGAKGCFDNAYEITVMELLYDYLMYDGKDDFTDKDYDYLYKATSLAILTRLTKEYFDDEYVDIARNEDIKQLVENYIGWCKKWRA